MTIAPSSMPLTEPRGQSFASQVAQTHPGMAHFAGTGPAGLSCRSCTNWQPFTPDWYGTNGKHKGQPKPQPCRAYTKYTMGQIGPKVPHDARACKHFEQATKPQELRRPSK
jgi:hypothetical protein